VVNSDEFIVDSQATTGCLETDTKRISQPPERF
jgi:hypothetical protein